MRKLEEIEAEMAQVREALGDVHGTETEVYARIVGYYRSVRNWNKGKRDEYGSRVQFVLADGAKPCAQPAEPPRVAPVQAAGACGTGTGNRDIASYDLFTRPACPRCPAVKQYMDGSGIPGRDVDVDTPEGLNTAALKGVLATPTVIFYNRHQEEVARAHNVAEADAILSVAEAAIA